MKKFFITIIIIGLIGCFAYSYIDYNYLNKDDDNGKDIKDKPVEKDPLEEYGYTKKEIKVIREKLSEEEIASISELSNKEYLPDYIEEDYFRLNNLTRYVEYDKVTEYSKKDVVMYVNIGIDKPFYSDITTIDNPHDVLLIVNKYKALPSGISPTSLRVSPNSYNPNGSSMETVASEHMDEMMSAAKDAGYTLYLVSGYRSESYQDDLYNYYVRLDGQEKADTYSARPNHSEHQTGLAADIGTCAGCIEGFETKDAYPWVLDNCYKFGFIERYPKDKTYITGYDYEPWHYRYVGVDVATIIHNENITFEEYYVKYIENKQN